MSDSDINDDEDDHSNYEEEEEEDDDSAPLHPIDLVVGAFATVVGIRALPIVSIAMRNLRATSEHNRTLVLRYTATARDERRHNNADGTCDGTWSPSSTYIELTTAVLMALRDTPDWENGDASHRTMVLFTLQWWVLILQGIKYEMPMASRPSYRGIYLPLTFHADYNTMLTNSASLFNSTYGPRQLERCAQEMHVYYHRSASSTAPRSLPRWRRVIRQ